MSICDYFVVVILVYIWCFYYHSGRIFQSIKYIHTVGGELYRIRTTLLFSIATISLHFHFCERVQVAKSKKRRMNVFPYLILPQRASLWRPVIFQYSRRSVILTFKGNCKNFLIGGGGFLYGRTRNSPYLLNGILKNCIHFGGFWKTELL